MAPMRDSRSSILLGSPIDVRRRVWSVRIARVLCTIFAVLGTLPLIASFLLRVPTVRDRISEETAKLVRNAGIDARYTLAIKLWPLSVDMTDLYVASKDGKGPAVIAPRATVRPRIFALLSGKVEVDEVELVSPKIRLDIQGRRIVNLGIDIPDADPNKPSGPFHAPFSLVSVSNASVDVTYNKDRVELFGVDGDLTTQNKREGSMLDGALRANRVAVRRVRPVNETEVPKERRPVATGTEAVDEDELCDIDARFRYDPPKSILIRHFSAHGGLDMDAKADTFPSCGLTETDKRRVDVEIGHLSVELPPANAPEGSFPKVRGHINLRAPLAIANRVAEVPLSLDGVLTLDADIRYSGQSKLPEADGKLHVQGAVLDGMSLLEDIQSTFAIRNDVISSPETKVAIAKGLATITNVVVEPFAAGKPLRASLSVQNANFEELMKELKVSEHPHVAWDLMSVRVPMLRGTLEPFKLDGEMSASTSNFALYDVAVSAPTKSRIVGFQTAQLNGNVGVRPDALTFYGVRATLPHSVLEGGFVSIGLDKKAKLQVDLPVGKIGLEDVSPVAGLKLSGQGEVSVHVSGRTDDPDVKGDLSIQNFVLGDIPFGNITSGKAHVRKQVLELSEVKAIKNKSTYELTSARVDFGGSANMMFEGDVATADFGLRDFLALWKMEDDPRFLELDARLQANVGVRIIFGGPEDVCGDGVIQATAKATARKLNLYGERFEDAHADFDYKWIDRKASVYGVDAIVRSFALHKSHPLGGHPSGSVLGSALISRGGLLKGSTVFDSLSLAKIDLMKGAQELFAGAVSGVATVNGTVSAYTVTGNADLTPVRINGVPYGSSEAHFVMSQVSHDPEPIGRTRCGGPIPAPFVRESYAKTAALSQGEHRINGRFLGGQLLLDQFTVSREEQPTFRGRVGLRKLDVGSLKRVVAPADDIGWEDEDQAAVFGGAISGDIQLEELSAKNPAAARATFSPTTVTLSASGQKLDLAAGTTVVSLANNQITVPPMVFKLSATAGFSGAFSLGGNVQNATDAPVLDLTAQITPIDLAILPVLAPKLSRASGTLTGSLHITGSPAHPDLDGAIQVRKGEFAMPGSPALSNVTLDLTASESELKLAWGTARFAGGDLVLSGRMPLKGASTGTVEGTLVGRDLHLNPAEGIRTTLDCDLTIGASLLSTQRTKRLPRIAGTVTLASAEYTKAVNLDASQTIEDLAGRATRTNVDNYDPSLDTALIDLNVRARSPIRVKNNLAEFLLNIEGTGLAITGTNQRFGLAGELRATAGGRLSFLANEFELRQVSIKFDDPTRIAPVVDATAVTEYRRFNASGAATNAGANRATGQWRIALHAHGPAEDLKLDMTSEPNLSQEDITLLLTVGLTKAEVDQLGSNALSVLAYEAAGTASGADRAVKKYIPIDDFKFGSAYSPRTGRSEPNITLSKRLSQDVSASVTPGLSEDRQIRSSVEWRLSQSTGARVSYDNVNNLGAGGIGNAGVGFRWRLEFE
jgi:translocation and assembly module TamB